MSGILEPPVMKKPKPTILIFYRKFHRVVLDEAHMIRNKTTKTNTGFMELSAPQQMIHFES